MERAPGLLSMPSGPQSCRRRVARSRIGRCGTLRPQAEGHGLSEILGTIYVASGGRRGTPARPKAPGWPPGLVAPGRRTDRYAPVCEIAAGLRVVGTLRRALRRPDCDGTERVSLRLHLEARPPQNLPSLDLATPSAPDATGVSATPGPPGSLLNPRMTPARRRRTWLRPLSPEASMPGKAQSGRSGLHPGSTRVRRRRDERCWSTPNVWRSRMGPRLPRPQRAYRRSSRATRTRLEPLSRRSSHYSGW